MLNWLLTVISVKTMPPFIDDIPPNFRQTKDEMLNSVMIEYMNGEQTWEEVCEECAFIEGMFEE